MLLVTLASLGTPNNGYQYNYLIIVPGVGLNQNFELEPRTLSISIF